MSGVADAALPQRAAAEQIHHRLEPVAAPTSSLLGVGNPILSVRVRTGSAMTPFKASRTRYLFQPPRNFHSPGSENASDTRR